MSFWKLTLNRSSALMPLFAASLAVLASCSQPQIVPAPTTSNGNTVTTPKAPPTPVSSQPKAPPTPVSSQPKAPPTPVNSQPKAPPTPISSQPEAPPTPVNSTNNGTLATISGQVVTVSGQPVSGVTVEFKALPYCSDICYQPHITTDSSGGYSINLDDGVYNALCIVDSINYDECGPYGGDGGPFPVEVPPGGQELDFIVCSQAEYPACLMPG